MIRWKRIGGVDAALTAMHQDHAAKDTAMRQAVSTLCDTMKHAPEPSIPASLETAIAATAELTARGRTAVERERDDSIEYEPEPEGATRLAQQFCQLAKGSARLESRESVDAADLALVHRVAFDTLHPHRASVIRALLNGERPEATGIAPTTLRRVVEDLRRVGLTDKAGFTSEVRGLFGLAGLLTM